MLHFYLSHAYKNLFTLHSLLYFHNLFLLLWRLKKLNVFIKIGILSLTSSQKSKRLKKRTANHLYSLNLWSKKDVYSSSNLYVYTHIFFSLLPYDCFLFPISWHCIAFRISHCSHIFHFHFINFSLRQYTHYIRYILISFWWKFEILPTIQFPFLAWHII